MLGEYERHTKVGQGTLVVPAEATLHQPPEERTADLGLRSRLIQDRQNYSQDLQTRER